MARTKLYTAIYVVLFVFATAQVGVEFLDMNYWVALAIIATLSMVKALFVAGYYQHLVWEPRSVSYVMLIAFVAFLALSVAASYSIL
ncbi:MAG: cytochrome C oxidase subunit IV family protein [Halolamina sp.]|uniref:cytochrome C oxidase subunit IV family protein n=1 Tax=Halolamina sp. TaxID=1940283 RepID=UPI002FC3D837